jgi:hypothetical protein
VNFIEGLRNQEGKSFLRDLEEEKKQYDIEQEMADIEAKAIADGTFMKAPNGNPTNLTERQWLQVRTQNFINWFGDWINDPANASKVVDENGEPLVVYHGSPNKGFTIFSKNSPDRFDRTTQGIDKKFYFTKDKITAAQFALNDEELEALYSADPEEGIYPDIEIKNDELLKRLYPVFLNIRTPYIVNANEQAVYTLSEEERNNINNSEGAIIENTLEQLPTRILELMPNSDDYLSHPFTTDYLVSDANQIKSATDNIGEFSTENDSILASPAQYEEIPVELRAEMADEEAAITAYDSRESSDPDLNKKFGGKTEVSVSEMLNNLLANNTPFEGFIKALQENIGELGDIKIQLVPNSNSRVYGIAGLYSSLDNTIYINRNANYKGRDGKVDNTIIHEIIHAIVANSLNTPKHREELGKIFNEAKEKILKKYGVETFEELPEYLKKGRLYGLQNLKRVSDRRFTHAYHLADFHHA